MLSSVFSFNMEKLNMESIQIYCTIMPTVNMKKLLWNIIFWQSLIIFATKLCFELSVVSKRTYNMPSNRVFFAGSVQLILVCLALVTNKWCFHCSTMFFEVVATINNNCE
jgi:hypothetical protein